MLAVQPQAGAKLEAWNAQHRQHLQAKEAYDTLLADTQVTLQDAFHLCCESACAAQAEGLGGWDCCLTELFEVSTLLDNCWVVQVSAY